MKRFFFSTLLFLAAIAYVSAQEVITYYYSDVDMSGAMLRAVSDNGRYVVGGDAGNKVIYKVDTSTGEVETIVSETGDVYASDVSDDGVIVGKFYDPEAVLLDKDGKIVYDEFGNEVICQVPGYYDGEWHALERPDGIKFAGYGFDGSAACISANGEYVGGYLPIVGRTMCYNPVIWRNGKLEKILPGVTSGVGSKMVTMSDDGSVGGGWHNDAQYGDVAVWKNDEMIDTDYEGNIQKVSANGYYMGGCINNNEIRKKHTYGIPAYWYTPTMEVFPVNCPEKTIAGNVTSISDNGRIAVGYVDYETLTDHHPFIVVDGQYYDFDEWMKTNYDIEGPHGSSFFAIQGMNPTGTVMCGLAYYDKARLPWILVFPNATKICKDVKEFEVKAYVDPASKTLNIEGEYTSVALYNTVGNCMLTDNSGSQNIDIAKLSKGVYFAKVLKGETARTFKIVVNQ